MNIGDRIRFNDEHWLPGETAIITDAPTAEETLAECERTGVGITHTILATLESTGEEIELEPHMADVIAWS